MARIPLNGKRLTMVRQPGVLPAGFAGGRRESAFITEGHRGHAAINAVVVAPLFMTVFLGTASACIVVGVFSLMQWEGPGAIHRLAGSALYLIGMILVTMVFVPRNEA